LLAKIFCSRQKSSTACSSAGRSTWAGTGRYVGVVISGLPPADLLPSVRRDESCVCAPPSARSRGTTLLGPLCVVCAGEPPHWGRDAGSTRRGCSLRLSSGGSGVIFTSRSPPGSHRPRVALGCLRRYSSPSTLLAAPSVRRAADGGRPDFR